MIASCSNLLRVRYAPNRNVTEFMIFFRKTMLYFPLVFTMNVSLFLVYADAETHKWVIFLSPLLEDFASHRVRLMVCMDVRVRINTMNKK